jgi:glycosyltransferase involved in cell wall biosynthesis
VYNGVRLSDYQLQVETGPDAPLVFLGRFEHIKGAHNAIALAKATGRRLILAGNVPPEHSEYFRTQVEPHLGPRIEYVGPMDDAMKNTLLGQAAALLMLIEWEEPFGIVMAEALACGTPVIGFRRGAVPEVVDHGVTGFVCDTLGEASEAVLRLRELERRDCRASCERRFSSEVIVDAYEALYRDLMARCAA